MQAKWQKQLWQLLDSGFPTGGFAHSAGLEAYWKQEQLKRRPFEQLAMRYMRQFCCLQLPYWRASYGLDEQALVPIAEHYNARLWEPVANDASRTAGRAWLRAL